MKTRLMARRHTKCMPFLPSWPAGTRVHALLHLSCRLCNASRLLFPFPAPVGLRLFPPLRLSVAPSQRPSPLATVAHVLLSHECQGSYDFNNNNSHCSRCHRMPGSCQAALWCLACVDAAGPCVNTLGRVLLWFMFVWFLVLFLFCVCGCFACM